MCNCTTDSVDHHYQMGMKYYVGCFSVKAWKYILCYFVNTNIVNTYILCCKTSIRQTKKYAHPAFWLEIAMGLIAGFSSRKGSQKPHCTLGLWQLQMKIIMKMSTWAQRRERDVNGTVCSKWGKKLYMSITFAMYTCVKMDAILPTIINIKLLFNFWNFPWYLPKTLHEHS